MLTEQLRRLWLANVRVLSTRTATLVNRQKMAQNRAGMLLLALIASSCGQPASPSCPAEAAANECPDPALSYDGGIGVLLRERCSPCHAAGGVEASSHLLTDYTRVVGQRMSIASQLRACAMPPAGAPELSASERNDILSWLLSCGAPK